jgi:hypothetical protein
VKRWAIVQQALISLVMCLPLGCSPPPSRIGLNDKIAAANRELSSLGSALRKTLEGLNTDKPPDGNSIQGQIDGIGKKLKEIQLSFENQQVPARRSKSAPALVSAYAEFLKVQDTIYEKNLAEVATIVKGPGSGKDKWPAVLALLTAAKDLEAPALKALKDAQKEFADEHHFQLVPKR